MNAVPDLAVTRRGRVLGVADGFGVRETIAALPCRSAVLGRKHAGRRDANPELFLVVRIGDDGVQRQPDAAGSPAPRGRVIGQAMHLHPILAAVRAGQKARRLGAGIQRAVRVAERPDLRERVGER